MASNKPPSDKQTISDEDACSLEIQDQLESAARDIAWQETYGRRRRRRIPMRGDSPSSLHAEPIPQNAPSEVVRREWQNFRVLATIGNEKYQGVYGIVHCQSGRLYVGSSVDIRARLQPHLSSLRCKSHHSPKLQRAWDTATIGAFTFVVVEEVQNVFDLRKHEQYWIDELHAFSQGFNSKSTADGPELSLATQIDNAIRLLWEPAYQGG